MRTEGARAIWLIVFGLACQFGFSADASRTISEWSAVSGTLVSPEATSRIDAEFTQAVASVRRDARLRSRITDEAISRATRKYLDAVSNRARTPNALAFLVEEIEGGGLGVVFPTAYPVLEITATFDMSGLNLNGKLIQFLPTRSKVLLLPVGTTRVSTYGGGASDCVFSIRATAGKRYFRNC